MKSKENNPESFSVSAGAEGSSEFPKVPKLATKAGYSDWAFLIQTVLEGRDLWDDKLQTPKESSKGKAIIILALSSELQTKIRQDLASPTAPTIWKFLQSWAFTADLASKITALGSLTSFAYDRQTMDANKAQLIQIGTQLSASFTSKMQDNTPCIAISELLSITALIMLPPQYQHLRTTLQETKTQVSISDLFVSLTREENTLAAQASSLNRITTPGTGKPSATIKTGKCMHNYRGDPKSCWQCHPEKRPSCAICKPPGLPSDHKSSTPTCELQRLKLQYSSTSPEESSANRVKKLNVDSGASETIIKNKTGLKGYSSTAHPFRLPDGNLLFSEGVGTLISPSLSIPNTYVCPSISEDLLSVAQTVDQVGQVLFDKDTVHIGGKFAQVEPAAVTGYRTGNSSAYD